MTSGELVSIIVATGGAISSIVAAWRSGQAAKSSKRNEDSIHAVHEMVNGGLTARLAPIVKQAAAIAITDVLIEKEEHPE